MPEVEIRIGGRAFEVSCQEGEEHFLFSAAKLLDAEAAVLTEQIGRLPEGRMLLMAGLMLADRTAGLDDRVKEANAQIATLKAEVEQLKNRPAPAPERVEVPVIPPQVTESLAELAARAEALAQSAEEKASA